MIIQSMTATFGRLENETLTLQEGLNVIPIPNEAGKSTWSEFLFAMLYGVDTRQRERAGQLPVKTRFAPWSGHPMEGSLTLDTGDHVLRLQRTSTPTAPMGKFSAVDVRTGSPVGGLTGRNCGQSLLGVEASVYERSAFVRQRQAAVTADGALEKRLGSLVTAGSEDYAAAEVSAQLRRRQTALQYQQTGVIPRTEAELTQVEQELSSLTELQTELKSLEARLSRAEHRRQELTLIVEGVERQSANRLRERLAAAERALNDAVEDRAAWEDVCAGLPSEETLLPLARQLRTLQSEAQTAAMEEGIDPVQLPSPPTDPVFEGMSADQASEKAAADAEYVHEAFLQSTPKRSCLRPLLALTGLGVLAVIAGLVTALLPLWIGGAALAVTGLALTLWKLKKLRKQEAQVRDYHRRAQLLLDRYQAESAQEILDRALQFRNDLDAYARQHLAAAAQLDKRNAQSRRLGASKEQLLRQLNALVPGCDDLNKAAMLFQESAHAREALETARRMEQQRREQLADLHAAADRLPEFDDGPVPVLDGVDPEAVKTQLLACEAELTGLRSDADQLTGALSRMGDPMELHARREELRERLLRLRTRYTALSLALQALTQADDTLRSRFAPLLCERAGRLFSALTAGRYDAVRLDRGLNVTVHPADSAVDRPLSMLSGGAVDQLYLALRLAICDLLVPGAPLVLDDALAFFDDQRAATALGVLKDLGAERQILLFTCQSREARLLQS